MSAGGIAVGIHPQLLQQQPPSGDIPANAITTDSGDPITLDDGTTYVTTDA